MKINLFLTAIALLSTIALKAQVIGEFTDQRDGEVYKTVKIGKQIWMAENLRYEVEGSVEANEIKTIESDLKYGRLYTWAMVMSLDEKYNEELWENNQEKHQGICPKGWHLPSLKEWKKARKKLGNTIKAKCKYLWEPQGSNASGFNAIPTGYYTDLKLSNTRMLSGAYFWTTQEGRFMKDVAENYYILNATKKLTSGAMQKKAGLSCRCIQD